MRAKNILTILAIISCSLIVISSVGIEQANSSNTPLSPKPLITQSVKNDLSLELSKIQPKRISTSEQEIRNRIIPNGIIQSNEIVQNDRNVQNVDGATKMPSTSINFDGLSNQDNINQTGQAILPPDTNGDVGPDHFVQIVNVTFKIFNKKGVTLYGPAAINTLWSGFGGPCQTENDGDPLVNYDHIADRWVISQFALPNYPNGPYYECIAVSQTSDPTKAWYRYAFKVSDTKMNDYPKIGVWPDGYYMSANQFTNGSSWSGVGVWAFERSKMTLGQPARMIYFDLGYNSSLMPMLPSDLDGQLPAVGTPNYFVSIIDDAWGYSSDRVDIFSFKANWSNPSASTFTSKYEYGVTSFNSDLCGYDRNCIPQKGVASSSYLDAISDRAMYRLQYRALGAFDTFVFNHTVDVGADKAGIRWYGFKQSAGIVSLLQSGTYSPDASSRWMGSAAIDNMGNLAIGYSASSKTSNPSIRYAGRLRTDPAGKLSQGETVLKAGSGSQTSSYGRWGDYSSMVVDPLDECSFWFTSEYYSVTSDRSWRSRVGAFRFPSCKTVQKLPMKISNETEGRVAQSHETLYTRSFDLNYSGGLVKFVGYDATGDTIIDDAVDIFVTNPDGTKQTYSHDYSNACTTGIISMPPKDLSYMFKNGVNRVKVVYRDVCAGYMSAGETWLINR